jgi:hypothetical protein
MNAARSYFTLGALRAGASTTCGNIPRSRLNSSDTPGSGGIAPASAHWIEAGNQPGKMLSIALFSGN